MKGILICILLAGPLIALYSQTAEDIDTLFDSAEDIDTPVDSEEGLPPPSAGGSPSTNNADALTFDSLFNENNDIDLNESAVLQPIVVSTADPSKFNIITWGGYLDASVGIGYYWQPGQAQQHDIKAGIEFKNDLYFSARPSEYLAIKGTFLTEFSKDQHNEFTLELSEIYFDYSALDYVYFKGGKLDTTWSNVILFDEAYNMGGFSESDILADSKNGLSLLTTIPIPVISMNLNLLAMYSLDAQATTEPSLRDLSFAAMWEFVLWKTSIQFFTRVQGTLKTNSIAGLQLKRSFWGLDIYTQLMSSITDKSPTVKPTKFEDVQFIVGMYRLWDSPKIGFNIEYLYKNDFINKPVHRLAFKGAWSNLAKNKLAIAVEWDHNFTTSLGEVTPGIVLLNVLPHANLEVGSEIEYGTRLDQFSIGFGIKLHLSVTY